MSPTNQRRDAGRSRPDSEIGRADRIAVTAILIVGGALGGYIAGSGLVTALFRLIDPARFPITLLAKIPVEAGPGVVEAHGDSLVVMADSLSSGAVWCFVLADLFGAVGVGLATAAFALVLVRIVHRKPFHRTATAASVVAGCATIFGSMLSQSVGGFGRMMAATELGPSLGGFPEPAFLLEPLPVVVGFGILALAYVFQAGERLQRDTEGLV
ncbi:hypothetical protein [Microbacterium sp.]|uniref:hypothetical protein n=1 Tax=Microbacterium sp. TaxID=51671 RepID=UPI003C75FB3C